MDAAAAPTNTSSSQMQPTLIASIVIWILIMTLLFVLYMCAACNRYYRSRGMNLDAFLDDNNGVQIQNRRGLERSVVDSLPIFEHRKGEESKDSGLECAICLSGYEEGDKRRRLNCGHSFHVSCIDEWFESNCSCPVCRSVVSCNSKGLDLGLDSGLDLGASESDGSSSSGSPAKQLPTESSTPSHNVVIHIHELAASSASESFKMEASPSTVRDLKLLLASGRRTPAAPDSIGGIYRIYLARCISAVQFNQPSVHLLLAESVLIQKWIPGGKIRPRLPRHRQHVPESAGRNLGGVDSADDAKQQACEWGIGASYVKSSKKLPLRLRLIREDEL